VIRVRRTRGRPYMPNTSRIRIDSDGWLTIWWPHGNTSIHAPDLWQYTDEASVPPCPPGESQV
jgi:hypothetical protein